MMLQPYLKQLKAVFKEVGFTWEPNKYPQNTALVWFLFTIKWSPWCIELFFFTPEIVKYWFGKEPWYNETFLLGALFDSPLALYIEVQLLFITNSTSHFYSDLHQVLLEKLMNSW